MSESKSNNTFKVPPTRRLAMLGNAVSLGFYIAVHILCVFERCLIGNYMLHLLNGLSTPNICMLMESHRVGLVLLNKLDRICFHFFFFRLFLDHETG